MLPLKTREAAGRIGTTVPALRAALATGKLTPPAKDLDHQEPPDRVGYSWSSFGVRVMKSGKNVATPKSVGQEDSVDVPGGTPPGNPKNFSTSCRIRPARASRKPR